MEMVLRKTAQALDLLSGQAKLGTYGWSQCLLWTPDLHLLLSHGPQSWRKGSLHLCPCLEVLAAPEFQTHFKVGSVVMKPRATKGGLTANFGTVIRVKGTMWSHLPGQLSDLESCVAV